VSPLFWRSTLGIAVRANPTHYIDKQFAAAVKGGRGARRFHGIGESGPQPPQEADGHRTAFWEISPA
jgi:hypothetical protein